MLFRKRQDIIDLFASQVGRYLDQQWLSLVLLLDCLEKPADRSLLLQLAQSGRIRRTHVENEIVAYLLQAPKGLDVVDGRFLEWNDLRFPDIDPDGDLRPPR